MKIIKIIFLFFILVSISCIQAQNLVVNPGFEQNTGCPGTAPGDPLALATGWHSARMNAAYFNSCANTSFPDAGVPNNAQGVQQAASGNAYAGMTAYQKGVLDRSYIYGTFSTPLTVGSAYYVSFKVCLAENASLAVSNIKANFALNTNECVFNPACPYPYPYPIDNIPNVTMDTVRDDANNWVTISTHLLADKPYEYIVLGVMDDIPVESVQSAAASEAFYYIDDVVVQLAENIIIDTYPACNIFTAKFNESCSGSGDASISALVVAYEPYSVQWSPAPGNGQGTTFVSGLSAGSYTVTITTNYTTCQATTLIEPQPLLIDVSAVNPSCGESNGSIKVKPSDSTETYTWSWNTSPPQTTDSISGLAPGSYTVTAQNEKGCTESQTFSLVNTGLQITADPVDIQTMPGDSVLLTASGGVYYQWSPTGSLSCADCIATYASPEATTVYTVTGKNEGGCTGTATARVRVWCPDIFIPTIFSPNSDSQNDYMCRLGGCAVDMRFEIYNRWGQKVFETEEKQVCWDGTFKGAAAEAGVYVYKLQGTDSDGNFITRSGNITLVR